MNSQPDETKYMKYIDRLVVVAHWRDFKLQGATVLGILEKITDGYFYIQGDKRG